MCKITARYPNILTAEGRSVDRRYPRGGAAQDGLASPTPCARSCGRIPTSSWSAKSRRETAEIHHASLTGRGAIDHPHHDAPRSHTAREMNGAFLVPSTVGIRPSAWCACLPTLQGAPSVGGSSARHRPRTARAGATRQVLASRICRWLAGSGMRSYRARGCDRCDVKGFTPIRALVMDDVALVLSIKPRSEHQARGAKLRQVHVARRRRAQCRRGRQRSRRRGDARLLVEVGGSWASSSTAESDKHQQGGRATRR